METSTEPPATDELHGSAPSTASVNAASQPAMAPLSVSANPSSDSANQVLSEEMLFRLQFVIPEYLRKAMAAAVESKDPKASGSDQPSPSGAAPIHPIVVMINSKSGGRKGPALRSILNELLSPEQVFDLSLTPPKNFVQYGLGCLEALAEEGDKCAKETRERLRIIVAGGDGTVGWVLGCLKDLHSKKRLPVPPVGIIPLGTGNDLSRSFGWGGTFMFAWTSIVKKYLVRAAACDVAKLDSWQVVVRTKTSPADVVVPHALHPQPQDPSEDGDGDKDCKALFEGAFYNYFSIGMDAQVAYGFHNIREKAPSITQGPISNKLVYSGCSCYQGWFCTPCTANPSARGLRNVMRLEVRRTPHGEWEPVELKQNVRAVIMLNLQSYASGRNPWGYPDEEYNQRKGFIQPKPDDGMLEIFGLFDGWHASLVMLSLRSAKRLAQGYAMRMHLVADQRHRVYMQMDGEPWRQPLTEEEDSTVIEITHVPSHSMMLKVK